MSHILKEYSKNLEVSPSRPIVNKHYYPVVPENYIVIYNERDIDSKCYLYYSLVLDLIKTTLDSIGLKVVSIGSSKNFSNRCDYEYSDLSFRKNAYIVSKAKLLISIDNAISQYASDQNVPIVSLYGNVYPSITTPYWSKKNKKIDIEPEWDKRPSLALVDPKDHINKIKAESIAKACLDLLKIKNYNINFETKIINKNKKVSIDVIPSDYVNMDIFKDQVLNLRLDRGLANELAIFQYCSNHKCDITIKDSLINPKLISKVSKNIKSINIITTSESINIPKDYLRVLKKLNININILVENKEFLDKIRFKFFDQNVIYHKPPKKKPENLPVNCKFLSFKNVVDGGRVYKSTYHWKNNIDNCDKIADNSDYWEELDHFYIYEQN